MLIPHSTYLQMSCPRQIVKTFRNDKREVLKTDETITGILAHKMLEQEKWQELADLGYPVPSPEIQEQLTGGEKELKIEFKIEGHIVKGRIDHLKNGVMTDFKTRALGKLYESDKMQQRVYALPFLRDLKEITTRIGWVKYNSLETLETLDFENIPEIEEYVLSNIHRIEAILKKGEEKCEPETFSCTYCPYLLSCPDLPSRVPKTDEDAVELANQHIIAEAQRKARIKLLEGFCSERGNIETEKNEVGYFSSETLKIDHKGLYDYLKKHKKPILDIFFAGATDYKNACKGDDKLTAFSEVIQKSKFGVRKRGKELM